MISNAKREARELDLGLNGRTAIICASSKGLGKACAIALAAEGADVIVNGRDSETLLAAVAEIAAVAKGKVIPIVADLTTVEGRARLLEPIPQPDILVTNCGGPPFGNFRNFNRTDWLKNGELTSLIQTRSSAVATSLPYTPISDNLIMRS
mgnify:CR=1 FL=1